MSEKLILMHENTPYFKIFPLKPGLTPLHSQYYESKKHNLDRVPFAPISQKQNGGAVQRVRSLVYNEGFHLRKYPSVFQWAEQWN